MRNYDIIFENDDLLVINKPHLTYVIPDRHNNHLSIIDNLRNKYKEIYVCHRLDAGTSGVLIFAKNKYSHSFLNKQFEDKLVIKKYIAITKKSIISQTLMLPIAKSNHGKYSVNFKSGKEAITSFTVLDSNDNATLILAEPFTGRTHQIRVHLKTLKAPLYYDFLYGDKRDDRILSLHCLSIGIILPNSNKRISFHAALSDTIIALLQDTNLNGSFINEYN